MFHISKQITDRQPEEPEHSHIKAVIEDQPEDITWAKNWYNMQASHHFFVGDESTIELFNALKEIALQNGHEYFGVLELHPDYEAVLIMLKLLVDSVPEIPDEPAQNAIIWMEDMHPNCWAAWQNATFYLSGGTTLINTFCGYLLQKNIASQQIRIIKY
jgi:hypothetical protein